MRFCLWQWTVPAVGLPLAGPNRLLADLSVRSPPAAFSGSWIAQRIRCRVAHSTDGVDRGPSCAVSVLNKPRVSSKAIACQLGQGLRIGSSLWCLCGGHVRLGRIVPFAVGRHQMRSPAESTRCRRIPTLVLVLPGLNPIVHLVGDVGLFEGDPFQAVPAIRGAPNLETRELGRGRRVWH